jgi:hypothetical protein
MRGADPAALRNALRQRGCALGRRRKSRPQLPGNVDVASSRPTI